MLKVVGKAGLDLTPELTGAVKERIKELVLGSTVVLFSKSYCPFCTKVNAAVRVRSRLTLTPIYP